MVVYEVSLEVDPAIARDYEVFLERHIPEVIEAGGFDSASWLRVQEEAKLEGSVPVRWVIQYRAPDLETIELYVSDHAPRLRSEAVALFGARFSARRRIYDGVREFTTS
jgi:hypothetical protein